MTLKEFMALVLLIEVILIGGMLVWAIPTIIDGIIKNKRRAKFGQKLSKLFDMNRLDREQIEILSKEERLNSKDIQLSIRQQFKESISQNKVINEKVEYFQKLYQDYEKDEPFEGLPSEIRLHLERVRETMGKENDHVLQPLASQLQDLNDVNIRKQRKMWWVSVASLMIGIASLAFTAYTYFLPSSI
ncbi:hypothetical protein [uncultured Psychromonas sp.]|uniref:hypothetical protein n=1 Tax=uncultured Psychromonas sp. TaxID=173974 RepID=UPI00262F6A43|nr:hypothetical protein [uncultured Psychromonas sp.]